MLSASMNLNFIMKGRRIREGVGSRELGVWGWESGALELGVWGWVLGGWNWESGALTFFSN